MGTFARLFYTNKLKTTPATLTPSSEATEYPASNLITDNYAEVWHSTEAGASALTIVADFGAAVTIDAVALGNINIRSTATVKIQGHTADSWGTPDVDETIDCSKLTATDFRRNLYHELASSASKRYWRISITDNGNPDGFIEVGEWYLGEFIELVDNFDSSNSRDLVRNNAKLRTEYEQAFVYDRDWGWMLEFTWSNVQEATRDQLRLLHQTVKGDAIPFFFVIDPTDPAEALFVRCASPLREGRIHYDAYNLSLALEEERPGLIVPK